MATVLALTRVKLTLGVRQNYSDTKQFYFTTGSTQKRYTVDMNPNRTVFLYIGTTRYSNDSCLPVNKTVDIKPEAAATAGDTIVVTAASCS